MRMSTSSFRGVLLAMVAGLVCLPLLPVVLPVQGQTASTIETSGQQKYAATNLTDATFPTVNARSLTVQGTLFRLGGNTGRKYRGAEITPFGTGTATTTFDVKGWAVKTTLSGPTSFNQAVDYEYQLVFTATCTLGTTTGVSSSGGALTTDKFCDTIAVTPAAYGTAAATAYGGLVPFAFSPGSNGIGRIFVPELGNSDLVLTVDMTGATSANFLVEGVN